MPKQVGKITELYSDKLLLAYSPNFIVPTFVLLSRKIFLEG